MAALLKRLRWRLQMLRFALIAKPIGGGADDDSDDSDDDDDKADDRTDDRKGDDKPYDRGTDRISADDDWRSKARKHERALKKERKAREDAERKLREFQDLDASEQERALKKAREEAREEALAEARKGRRADRLEVSVTRLSARGFKIGQGDDAKTLRFADPDDAIMHLERAIARGEIDEDDVFDSEGKVNTEALTTALGELLERKPHLAASDDERPKPKGDADMRKGEPTSKDLERMSVEDHISRKYPALKK